MRSTFDPIIGKGRRCAGHAHHCTSLNFPVEAGVSTMSFSPDPASPRFSEKLTAAKIKKLTSLILRSEHPRTSDAVIAPLLELVSDGEGCMYSQ